MESSDLFSHPVDKTDVAYETANEPVRHPIFSGRTEYDASEPASS
ncbi:hypothetical protein [Mycobacterium sp. EPa45]|nr:hypothetical protein [Mycobacterium sp. EPa45]